MTRSDHGGEPDTFAVAQITNRWLEHVLSGAGFGDVHVAGFRTSSVGTGQASVCYRIHLEAADRSSGIPPSIIAKFPADEETSRTSAATGGTYLREVQFYRELQPRVSIRTPRCYYADIRDRGPDFALVLEDRAPARQGDQIAGCDADLAAVALAELVGLHAPTWLDGPILDLPWVSSSHPDRPKFMMQIYRQGLAPFMDRCADGLAPGHVDFIDRLGAQDLYPDFPDDKSFCVVHNDFRLDNFLFEDERLAETLHVVDWQTYGAGNPMTDVAYFLGGCLLPEVRLQVEKDLVAEYHGRLTAAGVTGYDLDSCWDDYRRGAYHGLMYAMAGMVHVTKSERGDDLFRTMAQRHIQQILDLGADDLLV